jgi:hypothetical protein
MEHFQLQMDMQIVLLETIMVYYLNRPKYAVKHLVKIIRII